MAKLEICRMWEQGYWDTEILGSVPFPLDDTSECWERCEKHCREVLSYQVQYRRCVKIMPWSILQDGA